MLKNELKKFLSYLFQGRSYHTQQIVLRNRGPYFGKNALWNFLKSFWSDGDFLKILTKNIIFAIMIKFPNKRHYVPSLNDCIYKIFFKISFKFEKNHIFEGKSTNNNL